jgi:hypothetical protein
MSLLIGTASDRHVLLTSDRRCPVEEQGVVSPLDSFQRIFPIPGQPLAVVYHGQSVLLSEDGSPLALRSYLTAFLNVNTDVFNEPAIRSITEKLADRLELSAIRTPSDSERRLVSFWVAGFAGGNRRPKIYEACWSQDGRRTLNDCPRLVVAGEGQEHLPPNIRDRLDGTYHIEMIPKAPPETMRRYHNKLFAVALKSEPEPRRFSEERDQLLIQRDGWRWVVCPGRSASGRPG